MNLTDSLKDIISLFEQEISLSTALLDTMKNEQAALSNNNLHEFEAAITEKKKLVDEIESTEKKLVELLKLHGLSIDKQDISELLARCNPKEKKCLTLLFDKLKYIATQCYDQNIINSQVISASQNNIEKIINILRGQTTGESDVYDLSGKSTKGIQAQTLGRV